MRYVAAVFLVLCAPAPADGARRLDCARANNQAVKTGGSNTGRRYVI
jgi:hypothetical protein